MRGCGCRCRERWSGTSPGLTRKCVTREIVEAELDDLAVEGDEFVREGDSDAGEQYFLEGFVDEPPDDGRPLDGLPEDDLGDEERELLPPRLLGREPE